VLLAAISDTARVVTNIQGLSLVIYGGLLVLIIAFLPNGLIDLIQRLTKRRPK
jgi:ABC-type branched-subunit amino acid transport system permease subunit